MHCGTASTKGDPSQATATNPKAALHSHAPQAQPKAALVQTHRKNIVLYFIHHWHIPLNAGAYSLFGKPHHKKACATPRKLMKESKPDLAALLVIGSVSSLGVLAGSLIAPIEARYIQSFSSNPLVVGSVFGMGSVFFAFLSYWVGRLSDSLGRKRTILIGLAFGILYAVLYSLVLNVFQIYGVKFAWPLPQSRPDRWPPPIYRISWIRLKTKGFISAMFILRNPSAAVSALLRAVMWPWRTV